MRPRSLDEFLKNAHVPFTAFRHGSAFGAQREAARSHVSGRSWAKTVICFADAEPIAAVIPAHLKVDLEELRLLANVSTLRLASEPELADVCPDCEEGAVSLFTCRRRLRVFVDHRFVGEPEMVFGAGTHTDAIRLHYGDFAELTQAVVGAIAVVVQAAARPSDLARQECAMPPAAPANAGRRGSSRAGTRPAAQ